MFNIKNTMQEKELMIKKIQDLFSLFLTLTEKSACNSVLQHNSSYARRFFLYLNGNIPPYLIPCCFNNGIILKSIR